MKDTVVNLDRRASKHRFKPHSCKHCRRIIIYHDEVKRSDRPPNFYEGKIQLPHTRSEVLQAVKDGCLLFTSLNFTSQSDLEIIHKSSFYRIVNTISRRCARGLTVPPGPYFLEFSRLGMGVDLESPSWVTRQAKTVDKFPGSCLRTEPIMNVDSRKMFSTIKTWIDECSSSHESCRFGTTDFTPTRLLEIGLGQKRGQRHVRLVETRHGAIFQDWASLSYVWGGDQTWKTLRNRLEEYHRGISIAVLPKTIRDAITVCRSLKIPYLWVDSLCIIQDDSQDVENELATMHMIYRHALVTIVAACCRSSHEGFLHNRLSYYFQRRSSSRTLPPTKLAFRTKEGRALSLGIYNKHLGEERGEKTQDPIDERAWTYQERLLSSRVLLYSSDQFRWLCRGAERVGTDPDDAWSKHLRTGKKSLKNDSVDPKTGLKGHRPEHQPLISFYDFGMLKYHSTDISWTTIVANYSRREISKPSDKLVALASVARQFHDKDPMKYNEYLAGLWKSELPFHLLWTCEKPKARPASYRSPTWSWASVDGFASYGDSPRMRDTDRLPWDPGLKIIWAETVPKTPRLPFGEVTSGILLLEGSTISGTLHFETYKNLSPDYLMQFVPSALKRASRTPDLDLSREVFETPISVSRDALDKGLSSVSKTNFGLPVLLLKLMRWGVDRKPSFEGLVLLQPRGSDKFQRIGYFTDFIYDPDRLERHGIKFKVQSITII